MTAAAPAGSSAPGVTTRAAIVAAAQRRFLAAGVAKTSLREIAAEAGVSRGTVYNHFADREAVVEATVERVVEAFLAEAARELAGSESLESRLAGLAVQTRRYAAGRPGLGTFAVPEDLLARLLTSGSAPLLRRSVDFLVPYLERARAEGEVRTDLDPERAAEWIVRQLISLATTPSVTLDPNDPDDVRRFFADHVVRGLA